VNPRVFLINTKITRGGVQRRIGFSAEQAAPAAAESALYTPTGATFSSTELTRTDHGR
jgi:hypothetical protein